MRGFSLLICLLLCIKVNAQEVVFKESESLVLKNNTGNSQEFTIYDGRGKILSDNLVVGPGQNKKIAYDELELIYKNMRVVHFYSQGAMENDILILNRRIEKRREEKFYEDIFASLFAAADEKFAKGFFSTLNDFVVVLRSDKTPKEEEEAYKVTQDRIADDLAKSNMTENEKAVYSGIAKFIRESSEEDPIILRLDVQKKILREIQPFKGRDRIETKVPQLLNRIREKRVLLSGMLYNGLENKLFGDKSKYNYVFFDEPFNYEEIPFSLKLKWENSVKHKGEWLSSTVGGFVGYSKLPSVVDSLQYMVQAAHIGYGIDVKASKGSGLGIGGNLSYNPYWKEDLVTDEVTANYKNVGYDFHVIIYTPKVNFTGGMTGLSFLGTEENPVFDSGGVYFGIDINLKTKHRYILNY